MALAALADVTLNSNKSNDAQSAPMQNPTNGKNKAQMLIASLWHSPFTGKMVRNETAQKKAPKQCLKKL